ncbi:von Ebner gland protein 1-like isoform X2 [Arvicanthis niloticus]|uniref:von Ebner gland protein 1-like isoform X2 n=1 Tax=Arvicanthis niloticus TaxID=61156 RepID=UPI00402B2286
MLQEGKDCICTVVIMNLLLMTVVLTVLPVTSADKMDSVIHAATYRAGTFPASADKLLGKWYITRWAGNMPIPAKKKSSPLPPFKFVINIIGKLEFRMKIMKPIGCVLFKQYVDEFPKYPGLYQAWSKHYIAIYFLTTEDFALAYYKDNFKHPTYIMTMLMGRSMVVNPQSLKLYETFVVNTGLNKTDIFNPPCDESCE